MSHSILSFVTEHQRIKAAPLIGLAALLLLAKNVCAETEFNIDALDLDERTKIDLSQFAQDGYILPGDYYLEIEINKNKLPLQKVCTDLVIA
ncbi:hypothetical protein WL1483_2945 [Aeromonas schubertii]|uniref:PapC N-terminal domain-containing protein n=1 Tax=Aeromonas schubertii TaxID=652 RepID=A0A0S2SKW6_9GAMM|nr:FimD/PapC N-terminal domain-containing protein [Aeromonas schubertii]ALP42364.1 hypothetical protein WL1483_2945 [Aeromonas schubertii]